MENSNEGELIIPKKLSNPCKDNSERKELIRELLFNQKMGKSVLGQKPELLRVMETKKFSNVKRADDKTTKSENELASVHRRITQNSSQ